MDLYISENEVIVIKAWADSNIHGGHWGDGDIIVPEEEIILKKLDAIREGKVTLTDNEARIILTWSESSMNIYTMEEESVIKKLELIVNSEA